MTPLSPMLAVPGPVPADGAGFVHEVKWDGVRALVVVRAGGVRVLSRRGNDTTATWPELAALADVVPDGTVLDGEVVALDPSGRPDFGLLQQRMGLTRERDVRSSRVAVTLALFDLPVLAGADLVDRPLSQRREQLADLALADAHWLTTEWWPSGGAQVLAASAAHGLEGVVSKRWSSPYRPGRRSDDWVKTKNTRTLDVVVVGWRGHRGDARRLGALVVAVPTTSGLRVVGSVGSGLTGTLADALRDALAPDAVDRPPVAEVPPELADSRWVLPRLVAEVRFTEMTRTGRLRHPVWHRLRGDLTPDDLVPEQDLPA